MLSQENNKISETQKLILDIAKKHFLQNGYKSSSLRQIVKEAGYTLGAFYGYYQSKEELFSTLVEDVANSIKDRLLNISKEMDVYPFIEMSNVYEEALPSFVDYLFEHKEEVTLLLSKSEGTKYETYCIDIQELSMSYILQILNKTYAFVDIHSLAFKTLMNNYYANVFSIILNGNDRDEILKALLSIQEFYKYGLMGMLENEKIK